MRENCSNAQLMTRQVWALLSPNLAWLATEMPVLLNPIQPTNPRMTRLDSRNPWRVS